MSLIVATVILQLVASVLSTNITEDSNPNKTKRTISPQVQNYGENRPILVYPGTQANFYAQKPVIEPEVPKQVAHQQVVYEFEQTPTNAVSNVHVNQFYQPIPNNKQENQYGYANQNQENPHYLSSSESIATPVQHSSVVRHGQNYAQVQLPLPTPHHIQTHQFIPGKYLYVNGKIVYQPNQNAFQQNYQKPLNYFNNPPITRKVPMTHTMAYRRFQPPQANQFQKITKPMYAPEVVEHHEKPVVEEEEETAPVKEREELEDNDEEEEEKASYEEGDDDEHYFGKYRFDDDDDHDSYREDDEEEDSERRSSKPVPRKHHHSKKPHKYAKSNNFKHSEKYSSYSKYSKPMKKGKKIGKSSKNYKSGKPHRYERIEGKQSQQIPVVHKQKIFKEKWYVTKSTDDDSVY